MYVFETQIKQLIINKDKLTTQPLVVFFKKYLNATFKIKGKNPHAIIIFQNIWAPLLPQTVTCKKIIKPKN